LRALLERAWTPDKEAASGEIIVIDNDSMRISGFCGGREWRVLYGDVCLTDPKGRTIDAPAVDHQVWACEHMLVIGD
jgi:hypothetical protein